ncbi:nucleotidyltransferase family protein [Adhaeribacter rhizoryzae]|uniref:Nucleotidyltransferase family protein n=1 Tax=Adhaeribacter rhizoryzae TaxID=2607907 RepID=A0A5M6CYQ5_9BACT|nr:nucleotidyltransferase family protein [Adhaeribacter rhizoryzae]KAA5540358.1 nucleotidyltransferase family protein [Adhaeribacter rhizoryzae]
MASVGLILLAAGSSSRLGEPKQNLLYEGQPLLQRAIQTALASSCEPVLVILGSNAEAFQASLNDLPVQTIFNPDWQEGMASSIRQGILALNQMAPDLDGAIIMVCDQPFVTTALLNDIVEQKRLHGHGIIACSYHNTLGTPALFDKQFFPELLALKGQEGAKKLLFRHAAVVTPITFPLGTFDIDTPQDYEDLQQHRVE